MRLWLVIRAFRFLDDRPALMRAFFRSLGWKRVWVFRKTVLVTGDRQVRDVLTRDDEFPLPDEREPKFLTGSFLLGMNRTPQHARERSLLEAAIVRSDVPAVEQLFCRESAKRVAAVRGTGHLDLVSGLSNPVGDTLLRDYFGVSTEAAVADDLRILGAMIASPRALTPAFRDLAARAAGRVVTSVSADIARARQRLNTGVPAPDTVLQRMVDATVQNKSTTDEDIRRTLTGALLPGTALVTRAFAIGVVQLFAQPHLLSAAREAVGDLGRLGQCMLEALRLHPVFPLLPRYSPRATQLPGMPGPYDIPAGCHVLAAIAPAMFDRRSPLFSGNDDPRQARVRPRPDLYLHFGGGAHECLGQFIALPELAAMLEAVLSLPGLRVGRVRYHTDDSITPRELIVRFEAGR